MNESPKSRYTVYGKVTHRKNGRTTTTSVGSPSFDDLLTNVSNSFKSKIGKIPIGFEHRPDLISNLFYDTPEYWWLILLVNGIADPFDQLNQGDEIIIPEII